MLATDTLRQVLQQQALTAVSNMMAALSLATFKFRLGDEPFVPPTDGALYGEFWFRTGKPRKMELGSRKGWKCQPGIAQFTIYAPEKVGEGLPTRVGDVLRKAFDEQQWQVPPDGYVTFEPMGCEPMPGVTKGNKVVVVDGAFDFYYRDPDAVG